MTDIFVAIADPKRREILEVLAKDEQTIAQLAKAINETPAATTKQVAVLKDAGLVKASRAKVAVYSTNPKALKPLGVWVAKFASAEITAELGVRAEAIKQSGILRLCVAKEGQCIENLTLGFTVRVYDVKGVEVWNSMWTGRSLDLKFKKPVPTAHKVVVEATSAQVVNKLTGNPISTGKPLKLEFVVE